MIEQGSPDLDRAWDACWRELGAAGDGNPLRLQLVAAWSEPQRHYHTREHLNDCLALFERHRALASHPAEVEMALWFHDAIYDVRAADNEARSAAWAVSALGAAGVDVAAIDRIRALIMATCHAALPEGTDAALLVDIDLAILGAPRERFAAFERQVREGYAWVPEALFRQRRAEILRGLLRRDPLYATPALRALLEAPARDNLAWSIALLEGSAP